MYCSDKGFTKALTTTGLTQVSTIGEHLRYQLNHANNNIKWSINTLRMQVKQRERIIEGGHTNTRGHTNFFLIR